MNGDESAVTRHILVIDDNQAIHEDFRKIFGASRGRESSEAELALFGDPGSGAAPEFELDSAYQGEQGLALVQLARAEGKPYAMAFVDVRMPPGWDGIETTSRIWQVDPDIQIVICTAYSDYSWSEMLAKLGRSDRMVILKKPFDTIEVVQLASALTEKWRMARQSRSILEDLERRVAERTRELVLAGEQLRLSEAQYRLLFESNPHPMWVYDMATLRFLAVNNAAVEKYGYSEQQFLAMTIRDIRPIEQIAVLERELELLAPGKNFGVWRHCKQDGSLIDVEVSSDGIVFDGCSARLVLAHDVTLRKQAESRIKRLNRVNAVLSQINGLIVRVRSRDELFAKACRIAIEAGGFRMAMIGTVEPGTLRITPVASAGIDDALMVGIKKLMAAGNAAQDALVARVVLERKALVSNDLNRDPSVLLGSKHLEYGVHSMVVLPLIVADQVAGVVGLYAHESEFFHEEELKLLTELSDDIAFAIDHLSKDERLAYLAYYDDLTGLANRSLFLERVAQHMRIATGSGQRLGLSLIDLERFKNINDTLGRPAGDSLLRQVAVWLIHNFGDASMLARVGADQYAVVLPDLTQPDDAARMLDKTIRAFLEHPFNLDGTDFRIGAKVGIALFPEDGTDAVTLFKHAEAALRKAKVSGERYLFYTQKMADKIAGSLKLENQLRQALEHGEFELHYQPKVSLASGRISGAEALLRWNDPHTGLVLPGRFVPILEEAGLIHDVGRWALRQAIADHLR
ncbi:MAG: diguanylate cyclase, partial [Pseudomonadota bacterium]|nr:diguanylate cyclase [Pseudomonadota bacterium]